MLYKCFYLFLVKKQFKLRRKFPFREYDIEVENTAEDRESRKGCFIFIYYLACCRRWCVNITERYQCFYEIWQLCVCHANAKFACSYTVSIYMMLKYQRQQRRIRPGLPRHSHIKIFSLDIVHVFKQAQMY